MYEFPLFAALWLSFETLKRKSCSSSHCNGELRSILWGGPTSCPPPRTPILGLPRLRFPPSARHPSPSLALLRHDGEGTPRMRSLGPLGCSRRDAGVRHGALAKVLTSGGSRWGAYTGCSRWGAHVGTLALGRSRWGAQVGMFALGCSCWGACAGVLMLGCSHWGAHAGVLTVGMLTEGSCWGAHVVVLTLGCSCWSAHIGVLRLGCSHWGARGPGAAFCQDGAGGW